MVVLKSAYPLLIFFISGICIAQDLPIELENIFTSKGNKSFSLSFTYSDLEESLAGTTVSLIQSGPNIFNLIRVEEGEVDFLEATASFKYGLTKDLQVFLNSGMKCTP